MMVTVDRCELCYLLFAITCLSSCASGVELETAAPSVHVPTITGLADANTTRPPLCDRPAVDLVRDVFCGDERPSIHDLGLCGAACTCFCLRKDRQISTVV